MLFELYKVMLKSILNLRKVPVFLSVFCFTSNKMVKIVLRLPHGKL